ncbi:unnamed protein product, partial [Mesorhabditis spiculigera]
MDSMPSPVIASEGHSSWQTLHEWFNEPHDYEWIKHQRSGRAIIPDLPNLARNDDDHLRTLRVLQIDRPGYAADHTRQSTFDFRDLHVCGNRRMLVHTTISRTPGLLAFGIFADLGIAAAVLLVPDRSSATFGCTVFAVTGTFATLFKATSISRRFWPVAPFFSELSHSFPFLRT